MAALKQGMAPCPACNRHISEHATVCPKCGRPLEAGWGAPAAEAFRSWIRKIEERTRWWLTLVGGVVLIGFLLLMASNR